MSDLFDSESEGVSAAPPRAAPLGRMGQAGGFGSGAAQGRSVAASYQAPTASHLSWRAACLQLARPSSPQNPHLPRASLHSPAAHLHTPLLSVCDGPPSLILSIPSQVMEP